VLHGKKSGRRFHHFFCARDLNSKLCCVAPSELFFKAYFASVLAKFPSLQLFFTPSLLGKGIKKGLPGVASLLILCAAAWPSPPG
jgi:hypothetical protein